MTSCLTFGSRKISQLFKLRKALSKEPFVTVTEKMDPVFFTSVPVTAVSTERKKVTFFTILWQRYRALQKSLLLKGMLQLFKR